MCIQNCVMSIFLLLHIDVIMLGAIIVMLPKSGTLELIVVNPGGGGGGENGGHSIYPETPMDSPGFPGMPYICYIWLEGHLFCSI